MLTAEQQKAREGKITASMVPRLMSGSTLDLIELWQECIGEIEPPDLADNWPVLLGNLIEPVALDYHEQQTGQKICNRGLVIPHPKLYYVSATLDGYRKDDDTVVEVKCCGAWRKLDEIINTYTPQVLVQMRCLDAARGSLLIVHGGAEPREYPVYFDEEYEAVVWERIAAMQICIETMTPPATLPRVIPPEQWRSVDLNVEPLPNWGGQMLADLAGWAATKDAAVANGEASDRVKDLIPDDVGRIAAPGVVVVRNRRGAVSIKKADAA